jgi:hypothetical protein
MRLKALALVTTLALFGTAAQATTAVFDFESTAATGFTGGYAALSLTDGGLTMDISRLRTVFDVVDNSGGQVGKPPGWASRSLHGFFDGGPTPFVLDFSSAVSGVSIEFGDYGQDAPDVLDMFAYSGLGGTGALLGSASVPYVGVAFPAFDTAFVSAAGIMSVVMLGGTAGFPSSVFYDNITVEYTDRVPEPATFALMLAGLGMLGVAGRRRKMQLA